MSVLRSLAVAWAVLGLFTITAGARVGVLVNLARLGLALWAPAGPFGSERLVSAPG